MVAEQREPWPDLLDGRADGGSLEVRHAGPIAASARFDEDPRGELLGAVSP
jgi:hypothetical protein